MAADSEIYFARPDSPIAGLNGATIGDFWRWAYSDILSNRNRSIFAEYIVGVALGIVAKPRIEWASADLFYRGFKIEVKSSAYCQSWYQERPSEIRFSIRKARVWHASTGKYESEPSRCADAYVFCLYPERDRTRANVLDIPAWDFYVISTSTLNQKCGDSKSLSLSAVQRLAIQCKYDGLKQSIDQAVVVGDNP